jgi:hypothetical protein
VEGEKIGQGPEQNTRLLKRMMENGHDAIYVEYKGRGGENLSDEMHHLLDWMARKSRRKFPLKFACRSARDSDNEFFFVSVDNYAPAVLMDPRVFDRKKIKPAVIEGEIVGISNSIQVSVSGAREVSIWISPAMVDLGLPVSLRVNDQRVNSKLLAPDLEVLLEDFRIRADRQKLFYVMMRFGRQG